MIIKRKTNNKIVAAKKRAAAIKAADDPRTWAHNNPIKKDRGDYYEYIYTVDPNKLYYGCPGAYFISMGNNVEDPWIEWEGWLYNATDLEDALYNDFGEWLTQSTEAEAQTFDGEFEDWVTPYLVENVLYDLKPFAKVVYDKGNNHTARGVSPTEWFNDNMNIDAACGKKSIKSSRKPVKASTSDMRTEFQNFLGKVDKEVSDALFQYDDAQWGVQGTMNPSGDDSYWFELNLMCDGEEAGTVNVESNNSDFGTSTSELAVTVSDSDEVQAEGSSFDEIYDTCVSELIRLAEDYVNFVRINASVDDRIDRKNRYQDAVSAEGNYEDLAIQLGQAINKLSRNQDNLNNFISYLTYNFPEWLKKFANTPEDLVSEFTNFANMNM